MMDSVDGSKLVLYISI